MYVGTKQYLLIDACFIQEILTSLLNVHISKASILLRDLTLSDLISTLYNSIGHMLD